MAYSNRILTSLRGRRIGLERQTSAISGGSRGELEFLVGPEALRENATTADTTATNLYPFGVSYLPVTTAASSQVYTIDPPVPGVRKTIVGTTIGACYLKATSANFVTTAGSSFTTIKLSSLGGAFDLVGATTAFWAAVGLTTGSSLATGHALTTST